MLGLLVGASKLDQVSNGQPYQRLPKSCFFAWQPWHLFYAPRLSFKSLPKIEVRFFKIWEEEGPPFGHVCWIWARLQCFVPICARYITFPTGMCAENKQILESTICARHVFLTWREVGLDDATSISNRDWDRNLHHVWGFCEPLSGMHPQLRSQLRKMLGL